MSCTFPTLGAWDAGQGVAGSHGKTKLLLQSSNMKKKTPIYSQQIPLLVCHPQCNISSRSVKTHARNPIIVTSTPTHLPASSTPDNHPACVRVLGSAEANPCPAPGPSNDRENFEVCKRRSRRYSRGRREQKRRPHFSLSPIARYHDFLVRGFCCGKSRFVPAPIPSIISTSTPISSSSQHEPCVCAPGSARETHAPILALQATPNSTT